MVESPVAIRGSQEQSFGRDSCPHPFDTDAGARFVLSLFMGRPTATTVVEHALAGSLAENGNRCLQPILFYLAARGRLEVSPGLQDRLIRAYGGEVQRFRRMTVCLDEVRTLLQSSDVVHKTLKGPVLAERLYPWPEIRSFVDLDILVDHGDLADVRDVLQSQGWKLLRSQYIHDLFVKNDVALEVHTSLLGHGDGVLFGIRDAEASRYLRQGFSPEELYVLLTLKTFVERELSKMKLLDLFLYREMVEMDWGLVDKAAQRWNASYPMRVLSSVLAYFDAETEHREVLGMHAWKRGWWPFVKYPLLMFHVRTPLRKAGEILFPRRHVVRRIHQDGEVSLLTHVFSRMHVFLGLRKARVVDPRFAG